MENDKTQDNREKQFIQEIAAALIVTGQCATVPLRTARLTVSWFLAAMPPDKMITPAALRQAIEDARTIPVPHAAHVLAYQRMLAAGMARIDAAALSILASAVETAASTGSVGDLIAHLAGEETRTNDPWHAHGEVEGPRRAPLADRKEGIE